MDGIVSLPTAFDADEERWTSEGGAASPDDEPIARGTTAVPKDVMRRIFIRCEDVLPGVACPASFAGTRTRVVHEAAAHAIDAHGYANNRRLRERIRETIERPFDAGPTVSPSAPSSAIPSHRRS